MKSDKKLTNKDIPEDYTEDKFYKDLNKVCRKVDTNKTLKRKKSSNKTSA